MEHVDKRWSSTNLGNHGQWSAEPTAPSLPQFSVVHSNSEKHSGSINFVKSIQVASSGGSNIYQLNTLTCRGCIPEAMRSLIIRTWARFFGSAGRRRGPGLVSSMYWITANCVSRNISVTAACIRYSVGIRWVKSSETHWLREDDAIHFHCRHLLHGI